MHTLIQFLYFLMKGLLNSQYKVLGLVPSTELKKIQKSQKKKTKKEELLKMSDSAPMFIIDVEILSESCINIVKVAQLGKYIR